MSKILKWAEAEAIIKAMAESYGFRPPELRSVAGAEPYEAIQIANAKVTTRTVGHLWWKKTVEDKTYDKPLVTAPWVEEALQKFEAFLAGNCGQGRVEVADKMRKKYADLLLDEKLEDKDA